MNTLESSISLRGHHLGNESSFSGQSSDLTKNFGQTEEKA